MEVEDPDNDCKIVSFFDSEYISMGIDSSDGVKEVFSLKAYTLDEINQLIPQISLSIEYKTNFPYSYLIQPNVITSTQTERW